MVIAAAIAATAVAGCSSDGDSDRLTRFGSGTEFTADEQEVVDVAVKYMTAINTGDVETAYDLTCASLKPYFSDDAETDPLDDPVRIDQVTAVTFESGTASVEVWMSREHQPSEMTEAVFVDEDGWKLCR